MQLRRLAVSVVGVSCLLSLFSACDSFLDPDPESFTTTSNYFQTPEQFEAAINSAYSRLRAQGGISNQSFRTLTEARFDCCVTDPQRLTTNPSGKPIQEWNAATSNQYFLDQWTLPYHTIAQTNVILERIGSVTFQDEAQRDRIIGQAKFIRALSYWYLVQFYGDVPLVLGAVKTPAEAMPSGRTPAAEVYAQIASDLQDAIAKLPATSPQPGRATKGAAQFLLGRTYLLTKEYPKAIAALTDVVGTSGTSPYGYRLLPNYRDVFDPANTNNAESIFELQFGAGIAGQPHTGIVAELLPYNSRGRIVATTVTPSGDQLVSAQTLEWYETGDARKDASIQFWRDPAVDSLKAYLAKFVWPSAVNTQGQQAGNIILFRYADALLSLAEAHWRAGNATQAVTYLNLVRARAKLAPIDLGAVPQSPLLKGTLLEGDALGRAIFNERTTELLAEGHRMFDLVRFGVAYEVMKTYGERARAKDPRLNGAYLIEPYEIRLPVPSLEVTTTGGALTQNQGW
jgi:starch-binding outer membrane protein, SusD/RagB family